MYRTRLVAYAKKATRAATPTIPAAFATYLVEAPPVTAEVTAAAALVTWPATLEAPLTAWLATLEAPLAAEETTPDELEELDERDAEEELVASGMEEVVRTLVENEFEALLVAAPPGVDEPDQVRLCPIQLVSVPDWMESSEE